MKRVHRKIVSGALLCGCALFTLYGASRVAEKSEKGALPVSLSGEGEELPVIVLDAGHGGIDGGCTSAEGVPEKGINLDILLRLRDILEVNGYEVRVTRDSDRSIHDEGVEGIAAQKSSDMDNRLAMFNESGNAVCVSVHQNQFTDPKYKGAQMFYSGSNSTSEVLARALQSRFRELLQPDNDREIKLCGKELFLCYYSDNPTVMAECGFMSNPDEAAMLNTEEYRGKVAFTLFAGINDFVHRKK
ncbi:MAG: N-acetylmuramoyl-L-alanine amidase [Ruminococcus sp.]|nr:N-acetylmuramoyl-L-alanine amidase [Ruminococcus sp.]